jgi:hypothetical protein
MKPIYYLLIAATVILLAVLFRSGLLEKDHPPPGFGDPGSAQGFVFEDRNGNGVRDEGEPGVPNVRVSDQRSVTATDRQGRWALPEHDEAIYFVVKPRGYRTSVSDNNLPLFYYIHKTTPSLALEGPTVRPTGPLPESIDFPLTRQSEPDRFEAIFMGDPQPRNLEEVDFLTHDVLEELVGTPAAFAVVLGDISFDNKETYLPYNRATGRVGIPFYNVPGNHDANYDGLDPVQHYDTWRTIYGPPYYSFDYGPVHFIVLADVIFPEQGSRYVAGLGEEQLAWIEEDLAHVPAETLVVISMHIPMGPAEQIPDFGRLYELLSGHPHTLSFSAHSHTVMQGFVNSEEHGWPGAEPHHHIVAGASCGRWWGGNRDEVDIPNASGSDGVPNGYFVMTFDGNQYSARYKAARRPADYQMEVQAPDEVARAQLSETPVLVNFFAGNERSVVEMTVGDSGQWVPMEFSPQIDPLYARVVERESGQGASVAYHIWEGLLPSDLPIGGHLIRIRATDMYGQEFLGERILRVVEQVAPAEGEEGEAGELE